MPAPHLLQGFRAGMVDPRCCKVHAATHNCLLIPAKQKVQSHMRPLQPQGTQHWCPSKVKARQLSSHCMHHCESEPKMQVASRLERVALTSSEPGAERNPDLQVVCLEFSISLRWNPCDPSFGLLNLVVQPCQESMKNSNQIKNKV